MVTQEPLQGGMTADRLVWLCQPEQIEETLRLLSYLNQWAKARDKLLYADRQGLYQVKAALMEAAYRAGQIEPVGYIDGTPGAFKNLLPEVAASCAADTFIDNLTFYDPKDISSHDLLTMQLYYDLTGEPLTAPLDRPSADQLADRAEHYILNRILTLIEAARTTRSRLSPEALEALLVIPPCFIKDEREFNWEDLEADALRHLDYENLSLIVLQYMSLNVWYTFHIPYRTAEQFVPIAALDSLRQNPVQSREAGEFYGQAITEIDSLLYPIDELMEFLDVDVSQVCPYGLVDKETYVEEKRLYRAMRYQEYYDEYSDDDDDYFSIPYEFTVNKKPPVFKPTSPICCRLCVTEIEQPGLARLRHWQEFHPEVNELTVSQVGWILGEADKNKVEAILAHSYRLPSPQNTRYWTLETISEALNN